VSENVVLKYTFPSSEVTSYVVPWPATIDETTQVETDDASRNNFL